MPKVFNTAAICIPQEHYMVNLDSRVKIFMINPYWIKINL
jgi:hypothetical protein